MKNITKNREKIIKAITLLVIVMIVNILAAKGYINGSSQSFISSQFPTFLTPAGFTFSIWGIIYLLLFISFITAYIKDNTYYSEIMDEICNLFYISSVLNMVWLLLFSYILIGSSLIISIVLFIILLLILIRLRNLNRKVKGLFDITFGLYAGWVSITLIVNFLAFLVKIDCACFGNERLFCTVLLFVYAILLVLFQIMHKNPFFSLSVAWGFFGMIKRLAFYTYLDSLFMILMIGIILLVSTAILFFRGTEWKI